MSVYYEQIRTVIDPEQVDVSPDGAVAQDVSVIMTASPANLAPALWPQAAIVTLRPEQAREFAFELLAAAEQADRIGGRR
ncbi:MAG TPA: hypothetical protein VHM66_06510 [Solirubrobacterales bacterium]|jgi:hypothetical protein|nr:hypothetical protein [Solirubrobacterales bacterium]